MASAENSTLDWPAGYAYLEDIDDGRGSHDDVSRVTDAQAVFLHEGNLGLRPPLAWTVYGDPYRIG